MAHITPEPQPQPQHQGMTLPPLSAMTKGIDHGQDPLRDSGNWSMPSKHSSTLSTSSGLQLHTILNPDDSPHNRFSTISASSGGTAASSRYPSGTMPHLNRAYVRRDSTDVPGTFLDSRRSSIDSNRVSLGMTQLALNQPSSPYHSNNASQTSLTSNLQQSRGMQTPLPPRLLNGIQRLSPSSEKEVVVRPATSSGAIPKRAPPIIAPSRSRGMPDPTASTPTKGFAWAFPDTLHEEDESPVSSRQPSLAASSVTTLDSQAFPGHHHMLQPKSMTSLGGDGGSMGPGNYSRTPELRVSHKLAERKRRSEMKDLFEQLNHILPNSPGNKSSKWEILTKAIDYMQDVQRTMQHTQRETAHIREEMQRASKAIEENRQMEAEITAMYQQLCRVDPNGHHVFGPKTHALVQQEAHTPTRMPPLPPMQQPGQQAQAPTSSRDWNGSAAMQGVEYGNSYDRR